MLHLDPWWNPASEDQATDRAHRIGQERAVTAIRLVSKGTIEDVITAMHEKKRALATAITGGTGEAGTLSTDDLIELLRDGHAVE